MIDTHFSLTKEEYLEAQKIYMSSNSKATWVRRILLWVLGLSIVIIFLTSPLRFTVEGWRPMAPALAIFAILLCLPLLQRRAFAKRFLKEKQNLTDVHVVLDDAGYHTSIPEVGSGVAAWPSVDSWFEGKSVFVMKSGLLMRLLPKAPFSEARLEEVRTIFRDKVGPLGAIRKR